MGKVDNDSKGGCRAWLGRVIMTARVGAGPGWER